MVGVFIVTAMGAGLISWMGWVSVQADREQRQAKEMRAHVRTNPNDSGHVSVETLATVGIGNLADSRNGSNSERKGSEFAAAGNSTR